MRANDSSSGCGPRVARLLFGGVLLLVAGQTMTGCNAFNPAFLNLVDPTGSGQFQSLDNAGGHVVVQVVNNADVDEELVNYLQSVGHVLTAAERRSLRPRIRMRLRITFVDGTFQTIEFITGTASFVDPAFDSVAQPDLNQNDFDNAVVLCDVASVQLEPGTNIEVFVPVELTAYELVETSGEGGQVQTTFEARERQQPAFRALAVDERDADGNVTLEQNIGVRDVPTPITNLTCGTVVSLVIDGTLAVPFLRSVSAAPSYDREDLATVARIGGRFEFRVSAQ